MDRSDKHIPVLAKLVGELLAVRQGDVVVDATVGLGGHAALLAASAGASGTLLGLDVDPNNLELAKQHLAESDATVVLLRGNFAELDAGLAEAGLEKADVILADLGVSSTQLDEPERGFSFASDGPLDMRMDERLQTTAADLVNRLREEELANILYQNAQERQSRRIARRICTARKDKRITRTLRLAGIVASAMNVDPSSRRSKIHPATRTFQALRIAVNDELGALDTLLEIAPRHLKPGGRIGVISFHSLEDGRVKANFRANKSAGIYQIVTKKPLVADAEEREANPRSRSAKLRVAIRTENEIGDAQDGGWQGRAGLAASTERHDSGRC